MLILALTALLSSPAEALPRGIVARVDLKGGEAAEPALLVLQAPSGDPVEIALNDAGEPPDVDAADGVWSGSAWTEGDEFALTLKLGERSLDAGRASWAATDEQRDLAVTVVGEAITTEARVSPSQSLPPQPGATPQAAPTGDPGGGPPGPGQQPPGMQEESGLRLMPILGLALGLAALLALVWWWRQPTEGGEEGTDAGPAALPEPGLVGDDVPSLSEGLSIWTTSVTDAHLLLRPLLATVARHHAVAFLAPQKLTAPPVHGGPVYRVEGTRPPHLELLLGRLRRGGRGVAAVIVLDKATADELKAFADHLPPGVGGVALVVDAPDAGLPVVRAKAEGEGFVLETRAGRTVARVTAEGLVAPE